MSMVGSAAECIRWLTEQPADAEYEVKRKRRGRSLTQNAYYWAMLNRLARKLGYADMEVHRQMLRDYGTCTPMDIRADVPLGDYFEYYDVVSEGTIKGKPYRLVKVYKRSSRMDSKEFSALIDGLRCECEQQGIPFMTPSEVASLAFMEPEGG